ncbi:MAG TPA: AAA family ATPase [Solirubrobacteraceae bacterium]|nr:AAA family ATPase [Solirubrobacteraceae bacterium]
MTPPAPGERGPTAALILIGSPGAGKTSVLEALATQHEIERIEHGAFEAEQLSLGWPQLAVADCVSQLQAILSLQHDAGRTLFLVSATVESDEHLAAVTAACGAQRILVTCLTASPEVVAARIDAREPDRWPGKAPLIERARRLARSVRELSEVDLVIDTEDRIPEDVAAEIFAAMRERGLLDAGSRLQ